MNKKTKDTVFICFTLFSVGYFFFTVCIAGGYSGFEYAIPSIAYMTMAAMPFCLMGEDNGNSFARLFVCGLKKLMPMLMLSAFIPLMLCAWGKIFFSPAYSAVFSLIIFLFAILSLNTFIFKICKNEGYAVFIGFICSIFLYIHTPLEKTLLFFFLSLVNSTWLLLRLKSAQSIKKEIFSYLLSEFLLLLFFVLIASDISVYSYLQSLCLGVFDLSKIFFITVFGVFFPLIYEFSKNGFSKKIITASASLILIAAILFLLPMRFTKRDASGYDIFKLSDESERILRELQVPITLYVVNNGSTDTVTDTLVKIYSSYNKKIKYEYIDLTERPAFLKEFTDKSLSSNSIIVKSNYRYKCIDFTEILQDDGEGGKVYYGEKALSAAICRVAVENPLQVYIEGEKNDYVSSLFDASGCDFTDKAEDADIIFFMQSTDINEEKHAAYSSALKRGASIIAATDFFTESEPLPVITSIFEKYGLTRSEGCVLDDENYIYYPTLVLPSAEPHEIVDRLDTKSILVPNPHEIHLKNGDGYTLQSLLSTSDSGYSYTESDGDAELSDYRKICIAAISELYSGGKIIWLGSSAAFSEEYELTGENSAFLSSSLGYIGGAPAPLALGGIRLATEKLIFDSVDMLFLKTVFVFIIPSIPVLLSFFIAKKKKL